MIAARLLGPVTRAALVVLAGATLFFAALNPSLASFAVLGVACGAFALMSLLAVNRLAARRQRASALPRPARSSRRARYIAGLMAFVVAAVVVVVALALLAPLLAVQAPGPPGARVVVPVEYTATATLVEAGTAGEHFELAEQVAIPDAVIEAYAQQQQRQPTAGATRDATQDLTLALTRSGWENPLLVVGRGLMAEREGTTAPISFTRWARRTTVTLPVPPDLETAPFTVVEAAVDVIAPRNTVLATAPGSDVEAHGRLEQRRVPLTRGDGEVSVEVAHPTLRNEIGALLLSLSLGGVIKSLLLFGWGLATLQAKEGLKKLFKRGRRGKTVAPPTVTPPAAESDSPETER